MKNNNSHKQPGLRLPLLPAPPGCGGPVPRGALPPDGVRRPRKGLQAKGVFLCPGRALGSPIPGGDATARGDPRALGKGGLARTFPSWGSRPGMETGGRETVPQGWAPRSFPGSCRTDRPGDVRDAPSEAAGARWGSSLRPEGDQVLAGLDCPSSPRCVPRSPLQPQLGRGAGGEEARGGPAASAASSVPLLRSTLERKRTPRVTKLSSFDLTHPRPGHPSSAFLLRGAASPLTPFGGVGIPLSPGDPGKTTLPPAVLRCPLEGTGRGRRAPGPG